MEGSRYPKRERKPKVAYTVPSPKQKVRKSVEKVKHRNRAADGSKENKWKTYRDMIKKSVNCLVKEMQTLEVKFEGKTAPARGRNTLWELERMECEKKILTAKQAIVSTLQAVAHENEDHKQWPQLLEDNNNQNDEEEDDGVDIDDILCSLCNLEETEDNDILLCDRAGCGRAYHQKCLDPPIDVTNVDPKHDWFCWRCECMDDCLDIISERLEVEYWDWRDVFPEVRVTLEGGNPSEGGDNFLTADLPDDEEDDDYDPSDEDEEEVEAEEEEEDDEGEEGGEQLRDLDEGENDRSINDEQEEEDNDDSDDNDNDDDEIDNDELQGLLEDANIPMDIVQEVEEEVPISRRLRQRNQKQEKVEIVLLGQGDVGKFVARVRRGVFQLGKIIEFQPKEQVNSSSSDEIESNDTGITSGQWKVRFSKKFLQDDQKEGEEEQEEEEEEKEKSSESNEGATSDKLEEEKRSGEVAEEGEEGTKQSVDKEEVEEVEEEDRKKEISSKTLREKKEDEELTFNADDITAGLLMYRDYTERLQRIEATSHFQSRQKAMQELVESTGRLDEANIVNYKRERKALDYAQLSLELFGTLEGDDDSSDEDVKSDEGRNQSRRKRKAISQKDQDDESGEEERLEEIDEEIDAEWDDKKKKSSHKKQSQSRKTRSKDSKKEEREKKRPRKSDSKENSQKKRRKETENNNMNQVGKEEGSKEDACNTNGHTSDHEKVTVENESV